MKEKNEDMKESEDRSFELLVEKLKQTLLVEGTRKTGAEEISLIIKQWLKDDKKADLRSAPP